MPGPLVEPGPVLPPAALARYSRQLVIPGLDEVAQRRLSAARVLVIGAGGLGCAAIPYLAAAGVGTIGVIDDDVVELSNLQRQVAHGTSDLGRPKVTSLAETIARLDPAIAVVEHEERLTPDNAVALFATYDLIVDGSDNFPTRHLGDHAAELTDKPLVWGAIGQLGGQAGVAWAAHGPRYRDLFPALPPAGAIPDCAEGGVLPGVCAVIGGILANEAVKLITGVGEPLLGRVTIYDARSATFREVAFERSPEAAPADLANPDLRRAVSASTSTIPSMTAGALIARLRSGAPLHLVDVREVGEAGAMRLPGSISLPISTLPQAVRGLDPKVQVILYCSRGPRSLRAAELFRDNGFAEVTWLEGGLETFHGVEAADSAATAAPRHEPQVATPAPQAPAPATPPQRPVSDGPQPYAVVSEEPLDEAAIRAAVDSPHCGAVAVFTGVVRNHDGGRAVSWLDYRAHPIAAEIIAQCCADVMAETGLTVAAAHRVGHLDIGDLALVVAVSAAHRREAFAACADLVERIKTSLPVWKRQHLDDGTTEWVGL